MMLRWESLEIAGIFIGSGFCMFTIALYLWDNRENLFK